jgi:hypothetical protein
VARSCPERRVCRRLHAPARIARELETRYAVAQHDVFIASQVSDDRPIAIVLIDSFVTRLGG